MQDKQVSFTGIMSQLAKYLPIGLQAFNGTVSILTSSGQLTAEQSDKLAAGATAVKDAWADVQAGVQAYNDAPEGDKSTALGKVVTALVALQGAITKLLTDIHVGNPTQQATVQAALQLIITVLGSIEATLQPDPAKKQARYVRPEDFERKFNKIMAEHPEAQVHQA